MSSEETIIDEENDFSQNPERQIGDIVPEIDFSVTQLEGVGAMTEKKLTEFGVSSLIDICIRGAAEVAEITGVAKSKADSWVFKSQKLMEENNLIRKSDMGTVELMEYQDNYPTLECKCSDIDNLIGGGVKPEAMYEVYGQFGSGKTQFCNSLTVEAIRSEENVIWIDCEDTFRPKRIVEILMAREIVEDKEEAKKYLERISYFYTPNTEQLMGTINGLSKIMQEKKPRLLVTNQVQSDPAVMFGDPIKPIGGNIVGHASTYRIYFKKAGKKRIARMIDSPEHPQADAEFSLTVKGVENLE